MATKKRRLGDPFEISLGEVKKVMQMNSSDFPRAISSGHHFVHYPNGVIEAYDNKSGKLRYHWLPRMVEWYGV